ncbi:rho guanine nucleotide exchange factor 39 [Diabrotica undecimpunctata]|uniref:rho guanine nucleotide exchange factor 39 n=1 Tax=Diabrotica undecimpunctata TaxID=50387 RepID=UPI003B63F754
MSHINTLYIDISKPVEDTQQPRTPKKSKPLTEECTTPCSVKLKPLKSSVFNKKYLEMSPKKQSVNKTPEKPSKRLVVSIERTPEAHIEFSQELKKVLNERNVLTSKTRKTVFDALDEIKIKAEEENRLYKREKALLEIIESETKYVHQLEMIINFFLNPSVDKKLLKVEDFETVFGNILPIYNVNKELLEELEKSSSNVAKAFYKVAPFFKLYSVYACDFKNILKILQNARTLNPNFAKFVQNQETRPEVQNKLSALLITPIQRVPRYKLLLTQLLNLTKPTEDDYESLKECLEKIEDAAEHINKIVEDQENMQRLLELQRSLKSGEPNIVTPGRTLVKEGILVKMGTKNCPSEKLYTVLMNDIILFAKTKKEELQVNSLKCMSIFPLGKCKVLEILDKGCMKILCQNDELVLYHDQFSETKIWIETLKEAIESHLSGRRTLRKDSSSRRPVKRKDMFEYHEVGISPGRPLIKKRKMEPQTKALKIVATARISGRKPILRTPFVESTAIPSEMITNNHINNGPALNIEKEELHSQLPESNLESESETPSEVDQHMSKELLVYGKPHNNDNLKTGFFGAVTTSLKKLFMFKK